MEIVYTPAFFYYWYLALRARAPWFFSAANPGIETGGMLGEKKFPLVEMIPPAYRPVSLFIPTGTSVQEVTRLMAQAGVAYPIIAKPDIGERGFLVMKIIDQKGLESYIAANKVDYIIQEYIDFPMEMGIMYYRHPEEATGHIPSVVMKEFLSVKGDGRSTLRELIWNSERAILQWATLEKRFADRLEEVLPEGELLELEAVGNHARGTKFINGNHLVNEKMVRLFDEITRQMPDVYYCRYDLRTTSVEDLMEGRNIRILEVNGVGADPAHIYDPNYPLVKAWGDLIRCWKVIFRIARYNHKKGAPYMSTRETRERWKRHKAYKKFAAGL